MALYNEKKKWPVVGWGAGGGKKPRRKTGEEFLVARRITKGTQK